MLLRGKSNLDGARLGQSIEEQEYELERERRRRQEQAEFDAAFAEYEDTQRCREGDE